MSDQVIERDVMEFDAIVVGAGPAGLAAAIRLKQKRPETTICVVEKAGEVGAHTLSGAVIETRALDELLPDWRENGAPLHTLAGEDRFMFLTKSKAFRLPTPPQMHNKGNYIVSLSALVRWLGAQAEALGIEIYPGFAAARLLEENGRIVGVGTGDMGVGRDGEPGPNFQPGMDLRAPYTLFAEGCRGSLTKKLMERFALRNNCQPQTYGLGCKELWEVPAENHRPGLIEHSIGWPMDTQTYGGSFVYHFGERLVAYGFVVGLDYRNPSLAPFQEMQRCKTHPHLRKHFEGGRRIAYGARALNEGGLQSLPRLIFPGGLLIGDTAGFLNVPKIKGTHLAMQSGMIAADAVATGLANGAPAELADYPAQFEKSWMREELYKARNIRPAFAKFGLLGGLANAALDTYVFGGKAPWTLKHAHADHDTLATGQKPIAYPKPDGKLTFDLLSSVFISNTNHEEDQPAHLKLRDPAVWKSVNWDKFGSPESYYCPAGVYETVQDGDDAALKINAQNCVHCKTCDIKDPSQNIDWTPPEGGGGPVYPDGV